VEAQDTADVEGVAELQVEAAAEEAAEVEAGAFLEEAAGDLAPAEAGEENEMAQGGAGALDFGFTAGHGPSRRRGGGERRQGVAGAARRLRAPRRGRSPAAEPIDDPHDDFFDLLGAEGPVGVRRGEGGGRGVGRRAAQPGGQAVELGHQGAAARQLGVGHAEELARLDLENLEDAEQVDEHELGLAAQELAEVAGADAEAALDVFAGELGGADERVEQLAHAGGMFLDHGWLDSTAKILGAANSILVYTIDWIGCSV
jgi:hypothetical protein